MYQFNIFPLLYENLPKMKTHPSSSPRSNVVLPMAESDVGSQLKGDLGEKLSSKIRKR